jgi:phosphonate transport system substrate-binding protein
VAIAAPTRALARTGDDPGELRFGLTAVILADQAAFLARWGGYLGQRLGVPVRFVARDDYQPIMEMLLSGGLDAAWICGYPFVRSEAQLQLLAIPLYQGQPLYQSYLIRPRGAARPVRGWADLRDRVFAYSDPLSNSGWLVAQGQLAAVGLTSRDFKRAIFAHGHRNVAEAVAAQLADAGSIDGYVWETMRLQRMAASLDTEVIWSSQLHGFPPIVAPRSALPERGIELQRILCEMPLDPAGAVLLRELNLTGFTPGSTAVFDSIRRLAQAAAV